nr:GGDEF domain-containing protein [Salinicola sp. S1-1-2]
MEQKLQTLASTDALTGLCNRRALLRATIRQMHAKRHTPLSLLLIDIDHFKNINDKWGHPVGDQVLRAMAERLRDTLRDASLAGRIGGEEFAVVLPETALDRAAIVGERLRAAMADSPIVELEHTPLTITISIGVTQHVWGESLRQLATRADRALYRAKHEGRNRCCIETMPIPRNRPLHRAAPAESDDIASP